MNQRGYAPISLLLILLAIIGTVAIVYALHPPYVATERNLLDVRPSLHPSQLPTVSNVQNNSSQQSVMEMSPLQSCDFNADGKVDNKDFKIFNATFGKCEGDKKFNFEADFDGDRCITIVERRSCEDSSSSFKDTTMREDPHQACDLNRDGRVDGVDLATFNATFGKCLGDPAYNPAADFFRDGCVDEGDQLFCLLQLTPPPNRR